MSAETERHERRSRLDDRTPPAAAAQLGDRDAPAVRDLLQQCRKRRFTRGRDVETALLELMGLQCGDDLARAGYRLRRTISNSRSNFA